MKKLIMILGIMTLLCLISVSAEWNVVYNITSGFQNETQGANNTYYERRLQYNLASANLLDLHYNYGWGYTVNNNPRITEQQNFGDSPIEFHARSANNEIGCITYTINESGNWRFNADFLNNTKYEESTGVVVRYLINGVEYANTQMPDQNTTYQINLTPVQANVSDNMSFCEDYITSDSWDFFEVRGLVIEKEAQAQRNTAPTLSSYDLTPSSPETTDDLNASVTCTDADSGDTLTGYVQMYKNSVSWNSEQSQSVTNGTDTVIYTLLSNETSEGDNWTAEIWCGDGTENTSKSNVTRTINYEWKVVYNITSGLQNETQGANNTYYERRDHSDYTNVNLLDVVWEGGWGTSVWNNPRVVEYQNYGDSPINFYARSSQNSIPCITFVINESGNWRFNADFLNNTLYSASTGVYFRLLLNNIQYAYTYMPDQDTTYELNLTSVQANVSDNLTICQDYIDNDSWDVAEVRGLVIEKEIQESGNNPPTFTQITEDNSTSTDPTDEGDYVTFTATATDDEQYKLIVCETNNVTNLSCINSLCESSYVDSGTEASCQHNTTGETEETYVWYSFVCDDEDCSDNENTNIYYYVNHEPSITAPSLESVYYDNETLTCTAGTPSDPDTSDNPVVNSYRWYIDDVYVQSGSTLDCSSVENCTDGAIVKCDNDVIDIHGLTGDFSNKSNGAVILDYSATESEGDTAIDTAISNSELTSPTTYNERKVYIVYANGTQKQGTFDRVVKDGDNRWLLLFKTASEAFTNFWSITNINVWENESLTAEEITSQVETYINQTN